MRFKLLSISVLALSLMACGGDSDSSGSNNSHQKSTLTTIAGIYDATYTEDGDTDVSYMVFKPEGKLVVYDYLGDTVDAGDNCYYKLTAKLKSLGNNRFEVVSEKNGERHEVTLIKVGEDLKAQYQDDGESVVERYKKTNKSESSFKPLCQNEG